MTTTEEYPLVSAIMLAGQVSEAHINAGIQCFLKQTYPNKELVIVNNAKSQLDAAGLNIGSYPGVYLLDTPSLLTAGMARNYGISVANGLILAQFDSDCWHAPERLETQIAAMARAECQVSVLTHAMSYSFLSGIARYLENDRKIIHNSMVFTRPKEVDYPNQDKGEEAAMLEKLTESGRTTTSVHAPELYCKLYFADEPILKPRENLLESAHRKEIKKVLRALILKNLDPVADSATSASANE